MASIIPSTEVRNWRENLRSMRGLAFLWSQQIWRVVSPIAWYSVLAYPSQMQWEMHIRWGARTSMKMWPFFFVVQSRRHTESKILFLGLPQLMIWSCPWMTSSHLISWGSWPSWCWLGEEWEDKMPCAVYKSGMTTLHFDICFAFKYCICFILCTHSLSTSMLIAFFIISGHLPCCDKGRVEVA